MSEKQSKAARAAAPVAAPLLAGAPIPFPETMGGDYSGASVSYDLDRVDTLPYIKAALMADEQAAADAALAARLAATDDPDLPQEAKLAAVRAHEEAAKRYAAKLFAHVVYKVYDLPSGERDDPASWMHLSRLVLRWLINGGMDAAAEQINRPF